MKPSNERLDIILAWFICMLGLFYIQQAARSETVKRQIIISQPQWYKVRKTSQTKFPTIPQHILNNIPVETKVSPILHDWSYNYIGYFDNKKPTKCGKTITVAVVDTGIDYTHPELGNSIWTNKKEVYNNLDDDKNGFVDDMVGWDFVHDVALPYDGHGHGTHISGIIQTVARFGLAPTDKCQRVKIISLKYYDNSGAGFNNLANTVRAIQYAVKHGADIINYSGGGSDPSEIERQAIQGALDKRIFVVAAAGNDGRNINQVPYYPASYDLDNIIRVTAINKNGALLSLSNFGSKVHFAAPGLSVLSLLPNGKYGTMSGTSQATAFVSGALAFLLSQESGSIKQIKAKLAKGYKPIKNNVGGILTQWGSLYLPNLIKE